MPEVQVPLFTENYTNVKGTALTDKCEDMVNLFIDEEGAANRVPGLKSRATLNGTSGAGVEGLLWWDIKQAIMCLNGGKMEKLTASFDYTKTLTVTDLSGTDLPAPSRRASMCTDGTYCFAANGGQILYSDASATAQYIADADAPITVNSLVYLDGYLICNNIGTNQAHFSNVNDSLTWEANDFFKGASSSDWVTALAVWNHEIYVFGHSSVEIWYNDGVSPFKRRPGGVLPRGVLADFSIVTTEEGIYWLSDQRTFMFWNGTTLQKLKTPFDKEMQDWTQVHGCVGYEMEIQGRNWIKWVFPWAGKTIVFDTETKRWHKEGQWLPQSMKYDRITSNCHAYYPAWGMHLVGSHNSQDVYEVHEDFLDNAGDTIRSYHLSGHVNYGTNKRKRNKCFTMRVQRGDGTVASPKLMLRWRDDGKRWSNIKEIDLGDKGNTEHIIRLHRTGIYRTRQYEISATDGVPITYLDAREDLEVLAS